MPNYNESSISGSVWQRCHTVVVNNQIKQTPVITFQEEKVIVLEGDDIHQGVDGCSKPFSPTGTFPMLDPETNLPTGQTMTHSELYAVLYSLYMQTALERDAAQQGV